MVLNVLLMVQCVLLFLVVVFTSQFLFNKSANRGKCLHPCRRSYEVKDKQEGYKLDVENDKNYVC